jgi:signal peptidase I
MKKIREKLKWLDPFTYVDLYVMPKIKKRTESSIIEMLVNLLFAALFAIIVYLLLGFAFGSASPLVIVFSESMEPELYRGDVIALTSPKEGMNFGEKVFLERNIEEVPIENYVTPEYNNGVLEKIVFENGEEIIPNEEGSIIVYNSYPFNIPVIHRTIVEINAKDGTFFLTKGDNDLTNPTFDQDCGKIDLLRKTVEKQCISFYAIPKKDIQGVAFANIPKVGCIKLWLFDDLFSLLTRGKLPENFKGIC